MRSDAAIAGAARAGHGDKPAARPDAAAADLTAGPVVVSVDVPSGVDASTGAVAARAVRATLTVTFHTAKPGLWIHPGKAHAGGVSVVDIGIPSGVPAAGAIGLIEASVLARPAPPWRDLDEVLQWPRPDRRRLAWL